MLTIRRVEPSSLGRRGRPGRSARPVVVTAIGRWVGKGLTLKPQSADRRLVHTTAPAQGRQPLQPLKLSHAIETRKSVTEIAG